MAFVRCIENVNALEIHIAVSGVQCRAVWWAGDGRGSTAEQSRHQPPHCVFHIVTQCYSHPVPEQAPSGHVPADADFSCGKGDVLGDTKPRTYW